MTDDLQDANEMIGAGYEQPAAIIDPPRKVKALREGGMADYQAWGWVKMSARFSAHVYKLKGSKLATWLIISLSIDEEGKCNIPITKIAKFTGYSAVETRRAIKELDDMGYLSVTRFDGKKSVYAPEFTARSGKNPTNKPLKDTPIEKDTPIFSKAKRAADPYLSSIGNSDPSIIRVKRVKQPAAVIPVEVKLYREVVTKYPPRQMYDEVAAAIQKVSARLGRDCEAADLAPYFKMWLTKSSNVHNFSVWLLEWAIKGGNAQPVSKFDKPDNRPSMETL